MASETTPLTSGDESRTYLFLSQRRRSRRTKIRQFQCCVCAAMLGIFVTAMVVTVSYSMNHDTEDNDSSNDTDSNNIEVLQPVPGVQSPLKTLLTLTWPRPEMDQPPWRGSMPTDSEVAAALEEGEASLKAKDQLEAQAKFQNGSTGSSGILTLGTPSYTHQQAIKTTPEATRAARVGYVIGIATEKLASKNLLSKSSVGLGPEVHAFWLPTGMTCKENNGPGLGTSSNDSSAECPPSPYRAIDGSCNNLLHPEWGVAMRPFRRVIPPDYGDGISSPRLAQDGSTLPSARDVSLTVHRPIYRNDPKFTVMLAVWGQFFDHDITATALSKSKDGAPIACCTGDGKLPAGKLHPECYPVVLSAEDPYYSEFGMTCMEFVRSAPSPTCNFGPREQLNQITSYVDGSIVYGSSEEQAMRLRSPNGKGELHMMITPDGRELLPPSTDPRDGCNTPEMNQKGKYCFMSGDSRANENMHLTTMHLLLAREHNRIVRALSQINPSWNDEQLYQEGRRIVSAEIQHITYNEFLPVILGQSLMDKLKLAPQQDGYFEGYNPEVNPSVANNFATAAFRFAHTLLPTLMKILSNDTSSEEYVELHKMLFNPYDLYYPDKMENAINGALNTDIQRVDTYLTPEVTQHLFQQRWSEDYDKVHEKAGNEVGEKGKKKGYGLDLASLNVQRGRDHGLPSYPKWRQYCGMSSPKSFADLQGQMDKEALQRLATLFKSVDDVDMYSGSLSEVPIGEGLLGPTFSCLIADQFLRLKIGDRYWYETSQQPQAFNPDQLNEIRKTSLASIICDNSGVDQAQQWVMRTVDASNPRVPCASIPRLQFEAWQNKTMVGHVKVSKPSVRTRVMPKPNSSEDVPSLGKSMASIFVKGTIISASIMATDSDGNRVTVMEPSSSFPKSIPLHLFDRTVNDTTVDGADGMIPAFYHGGGGVSWTGVLSMTDPMQASLKGNFTVPLFKHGPTPFDFLIDKYTGDFDITMKLEENVSFYGLPELQGTYNSGIYFQVEYASSIYSSPSTKEKMESAGEKLEKGGSLLPQAPIMLYGSYSLNHMTFYWNGNVSLILPSPPAATLTKFDSGMNDWAKSKSSSTSVEVTATWGVITAASGPASGNQNSGSKTVVTTWWDGSFPVAIPQPAFDIIASNDSETVLPLNKAVNPGGGVTWSGSLSPVAGSATGDVQLNGTYSFPVFIHGQKGNQGGLAVFAEKFWRGNFSLVLRPSFANDATPLTSSLNNLASGGPYKSPIFFQASDHMVETPGFWGLPEVGPIVPIILHGHTSLDKSVFFWTGNATISVPEQTITEKSDKDMAKMKKENSLKSSEILKAASNISIPLNLKILLASVNITISSSLGITEKNISWNGIFPLTIPQPAFYNSTRPTLTLSETPIDDNYPNYSPLAKPGKYKSEMLWSKISAKMLNSSATQVQVNGSFSFPIFYFGGEDKGIWLGPTVKNWNGLFSAILETTGENIDAINPFLSIISAGYFKSSVYFIEEDNVEGDETLKAYIKETDSKPLDSLELVVMLRGSKSPDKTEFYWNGDMTLLIPMPSLTKNGGRMLKATSKTKSISYLSNSYLSGTVVSGNIMATSSKGKVMWWNGDLPLPIAMPAFDSVSADAGVYRWPYETPFYNGTGGVTWIGSMARTSTVHNGIIAKGAFSVPVFVHGNPSAFEIIEWNGDFSLEISLNVNRTGSTSPLAEGKYNSPIFFRECSWENGTEEEVISQVQELLASASSAHFGAAAYHTLPRVPVILWGNHSADGKTFYWQGNISAIFPPVLNSLSSNSEYITKETDAEKQVSAFYKGKRVRSVVKVLSGSITASSATFADKELWDGTLPLTIQTSVFFSKGVSFIGGPAKWNGHFASADSVENGAHLEGSFSIPMLARSNTSTMSFENWTGDFSFLVSFAESANIKELLPSAGTCISRIVLGTAHPHAEATLQQSSIEPKRNDPLDMALNDVMDSISESTSYSALHVPLILLGDFSVDKKTFMWKGDAVVYLPQESSTLAHSSVSGQGDVQVPSSISPAPPILHKPVSQKMFGFVTLGKISGGTGEDSIATLWDGSFPAKFPMPAFDRFSNSTEALDPSIPLSERIEGITWNLTSVTPTAGGVQVKGNFIFPIYTHGNHGTFSITVWKGEFSLNAMLPGDQSIGILKESANYRSSIYFHHSKSEWDPFNLNEQTMGNDGSIDMSNRLDASLARKVAKRSIIILQGERGKSTFLWSGKFVFVFTK